ncbi:MAG: hypothetical protein HC824_17025 [Synechococcales cyanobacterium RM1_1_8]|nr:hypothetical protein [Synechococcales cyanobacterium RM1_1_8]
MDKLIDLYRGNPLWLKVAATTINEFFDGNVAQFLSAGKLIYDEQKSALKPQFVRLQPAELEVMGWLAINRRPVSLETLQADIFDGTRRADLVYTLRSLERCSLVEPPEDNAGRYGLQPVVLEFATNRLINRIVDELIPLEPPRAVELPGDSSRGEQSEKPDGKPDEKQVQGRPAAPQEQDCFNRYCLVKADGEEHLQQEQKQAILRPIYEKLLSRAGSFASLKAILERQLKQRREQAGGQAGYFGGNLLSLFAELQQDYSPRVDEATPADFSRLPIWQASFRDVQPERFSFQDCAIDRANFLENLGDVFTLAFNHPRAGAETGPTLLAAGDSNGRVHLWKLPEGQKLLDWQGHQSWVETLAFSDDGRWLATGGDDNYFRLWELRPEIQSHQSPLLTYEYLCDDWVRSLAIARGSDYIAWSSGSQVWIYRLEQRSRLSSTQPWITLPHLADADAAPSPSLCVRAIAFSDDGKWLATGGDDHLIRLWDFEKIRATAPQPPQLPPEAFLLGALKQKHQGWVRALAFSPQGDRLVSSSDDGTVQRWQLRPTAQGDRFVPQEPSLKDHCERVRAIAIDAGGRLLASGGDDGQLRLWDLQRGQARPWAEPELALSWGRIWAVALSQRQGRPLLAWGDDAQTIRLLELNLDGDSHGPAPDTPVKATLLRSLRGHTSSIRSAVFIANPKTGAGLPWIVSGGDSHQLHIWETQADVSGLEQRPPVATLSGHQGRIWQLAYHPESKILASASDDKTVRLWNIATQDCLQILTGHSYWVRTVAFSPSGLTLASAGDDETIRLWDVRSGVHLHTLGDSRQGPSLSRSPQRPGHNHWIRSIAFSPDGRTLASGGDGRRVLLWDLADLEANPAASNPAELSKPALGSNPRPIGFGRSPLATGASGSPVPMTMGICCFGAILTAWLSLNNVGSTIVGGLRRSPLALVIVIWSVLAMTRQSTSGTWQVGG